MSFPDDRKTVWAAGTGVSDSLQSLMGTIVIAVFVITFIVQAFQIPSPSMENTLLIGDYLLVNKLCYGGGGLGNYLMPYRRVRRGDIVVFHYPVNPAQHFVKRVIGVPGDRVRLVNDVDVEPGLAAPAGHQTSEAQDPLVRDHLADQAAQLARGHRRIHRDLRLRTAIRSGPQHVYYRFLI